MDIFNSEEREIRCVRNDNNVMGCSENGHLLEIGKVYHLEDIEVYSWHTVVYLKEFPDTEFNSVLFEEIEENA